MAGRKFYSVNVSPTITGTIQAAGVFPDNGVVFDFTEVPIDRGSNRLTSITIINRDHAAAKPAVFAGEIFFSSSSTLSLGTVRATASMKPTNDLIGTTTFATGDFDTTLDLISIATINPNIVLESKDGSSIYVGMTTTTASEPDLRSSLTVDGAEAVGQTVITTADVDPRDVFAVGDVLVTSTDEPVGTVVSTDSATQITLASGLTEIIENDDVLHISSPIKLILGFEVI